MFAFSPLVDETDYMIDVFFDRHIRVVDDHGVGGGNARGVRPVRIVVVAFYHLHGDLFKRHLRAFCCEFFVSASGSRLSRSGLENFQIGVRQYDRADIASVHYDVVFFSRFTLQIEQKSSDLGYRRDF